MVVGEGELVTGLLLCGISFIIRSNMGLCISVYMSFLCNVCALRLYVCGSVPTINKTPIRT
jgi:hypothetical protein